jgi:hypothetical protein
VGASSAQTTEAVTEAEARFKEGLKRHDAGDEEGARLSFLQAFSVIKRPNITFNLARAEQLTGHPVDAIQHYKVFVADSTVTGADRELARKRIAELSAVVGHLSVVAPSGAELWVDQVAVGKAPLNEPLDVATGMHTVQGKVGDKTATVTAVCNAGQVATATLDLEGAQGVVVAPVPPGTQGAGEPSFHYETPGAKVAVVIGMGAGVVGLISGGIGLEIAGSSASNAAMMDRMTLQMGTTSTSVCPKENPTTCANLMNENNSAASDRNTAIGLFVGAGALAAVAVVTWIVWPKSKVYDVKVAPVVTPSAAGLSFGGVF